MEGQTKLSAGQIGILINARIKDMAMWLMEDFGHLYPSSRSLVPIVSVMRTRVRGHGNPCTWVWMLMYAGRK